MNKYIIPVTDCDTVWNIVIMAKTYSDCKDRIIEYFVDNYTFVNDDNITYQELLDILDEHDILIGKIQDIEEL